MYLYYNPKYDILRVCVPNHNLLYGEEKYIKYVLTDEWILIDDEFIDSEIEPILTLSENKLYFLDSNGKINELERNY